MELNKEEEELRLEIDKLKRNIIKEENHKGQFEEQYREAKKQLDEQIIILRYIFFYKKINL